MGWWWRIMGWENDLTFLQRVVQEPPWLWRPEHTRAVRSVLGAVSAMELQADRAEQRIAELERRTEEAQEQVRLLGQRHREILAEIRHEILTWVSSVIARRETGTGETLHDIQPEGRQPYGTHEEHVPPPGGSP